MSEFKTLLERIEDLYGAQKSVLTLAELSRYTGLSKSCLYKLTSSRKIPFSCPNGKTLFFEKAAINRWLLSNPVRTADEIDIAAANYVVLNPNHRRQA
ncbi:helix-turn-helix domain-containing protein [Mucilaginibacter sp.]|uniref:helix-turn-helix domain-containing protein n=1 Tax=Mucilaginibacter sp. TaxID=1882438 RepID=UPI00260B5DDF|nr:helix-turn-helix domain-containing protein [Mucilaginibacter sp.]MDB5129406.1 hypothetical protein [Mucilaginibacter sp.]